MPPKTPASAISATAYEKLGNARTLGRPSEVTVNGALSPNAASRINAAAQLTVEWPDGYLGNGGVPVCMSSQGVQVGSGSALLMPARIAAVLLFLGLPLAIFRSGRAMHPRWLWRWLQWREAVTDTHLHL